jgi:glycosyltransferase involved in cell wall biosynthesis
MRFENNADAQLVNVVTDQFDSSAFRVIAGDSAVPSDAKDRCGCAAQHPAGALRVHRDRPLRIMFMQTDMRIGGAEMLTANIIRRLNRQRFAPELCCLKDPGELGEDLASEIPVHHHLLANKYDLRVWPRLTHLLRKRAIDTVITVGAGDKMFWGRLAARRVGVPAVLSALHSTGWPDGVGRLNRMLTPITDSFIAVADSHGQFLAKNLRIPNDRVAVIPNGVDTNRYAPTPDVPQIRRELGIGPTDPVLGIVAALRPEKNHELFLDVAARVVRELPKSRFLIVGDGPCRPQLEERARELGLTAHTIFTGSRPDVPRLLAAMDVFGLTSRMEANPLSILEAMSVGRPVVATNVGSIHEAVIEAQTGFLVESGNVDQFADRVIGLLNAPVMGHVMGATAREVVIDRWSIEAMVAGYERLIETTYARKTQAALN